MARYSNVQTDFSGGLVSEYLIGRKDLKKSASAARKFTNFLPTLQGPASYRRGTERVGVGDSSLETSTTVELTLSTASSYRIVFKSLEVEVYSVADGSLKATISSPYSSGDLKDLRFSSETDALYITHPNFPPKKLTPGFVQTYPFLYSTEAPGSTYPTRALYADGSLETPPVADRQLRASIEELGDTAWTLENLDFTVEPFLPPDESGTDFTLLEGDRYIKLESTTNAFTGVTAGNYLEYQEEGEWLLGLVVDSTEATSYTILDPSSSTVYIKPVSSVVDIEDPNARLFLLDNDTETDLSGLTAGTVAYQDMEEKRESLKQDDVPEGEVHVRSDVLVFRKGFEGSWLRIGDDRRSDQVVQGHQRTATRWVRVKEHLGTEDHPVDFIRSRDPFDDLELGSTYKFYTNATRINVDYFIVGPDVDGNLDITTGMFTIPSGNRVFTMSNGVTISRPHHGSSWNGVNVSFGASIPFQIVGNLSTQKQFDVFKCFDSSDSGHPLVEGSNLHSITSAVTSTIIANDATLLASEANTFPSSDAILNRHFMCEMGSGNAYVKCIAYGNSSSITVRLLNPVPRNKRNFAFENGGKVDEIRFGAWYLNNYPRCVAKFEQRRIYGGTISHPNFLFFSQVDKDLDFRPTADDGSVTDTDGFTYDLSNRSAAVTWLLALKDLIIGTTGGLYKVVPNQYQYGISPKTIRIELSEEEPCRAQAVLVGNSIFYPDSAGARLLEYKFEANINNAASNDITKFIYPTFVNDPIKKIDYQHTPIPKIWVVTEAGNVYCLTYHRQEEFYAWSKQEIGAKVHDISVQPRTSAQDSDTVMFTVERDNTYYFEKLDELKQIAPVSPYSGTTIKTVVPHLDSFSAFTRDILGAITFNFSSYVGETVSVVADGAYVGDYVVATSTTFTGYTIPTNINSLIIGKKYTGEIQMMIPVWDGQNKPAYGSETQRIISMKPCLVDSVKYSAGIGTYETRTLSPITYDYGVDTFTGFDKELPVPGSTFGVDKVPTIKQTEPYPLTLASIVLKSDLS